MSTEVLDEPQTTLSEEEQTSEKGRFSLSSKKTRVMILLVLIMAVEAAGMYLLLPGRNTDGQEDKDSVDPVEVETVEVELDTFRAVNTIASPGQRIHMEFKLTAVVARDQEIAFQQAATKEHPARVKQAVEQVFRSASMEELNDPKLNVIRRKIKEEINKALRKSYVHQIIISGFTPIY